MVEIFRKDRNLFETKLKQLNLDFSFKKKKKRKASLAIPEILNRIVIVKK